MVRLANQVTRKNTSELVTGTIGFVDDSGRETRAVVEAIVWEMPKMGFILGLPDMLRNFLDIFVKMSRETERTLSQVDVSMALTEGDQGAASAEASINTNMQGNEVRDWSNGQNTEAPGELDTPEPSHFDPVLQFIDIPYEKAKAEYFDMLDGYIGDMLKESAGFKELVNSTLALGRFVPSKWVGIKGFPLLDLVVREDFSSSHKVRARSINPRLYAHTEKKFQRLLEYLYQLSRSPWESALVVAAKVTKPFMRFCGDYRWFNGYCVLPQAYIPRVQYELEKAMGFKIFSL